jgi:hypothetical protein
VNEFNEENLMKWMTACCALLFPLSGTAGTFPALIPDEKPDYPLSTAVARLYDQWNPHEDRGNALYSNFKYTPLEGFERKPHISRRDPSKVLLIDGVYHVWYTCRKSAGIPAGKQATDTIPSFDWDLCDLWHATSSDGWVWKEDDEPAVRRLAKPGYGWRSISTTDVLIWKGKYYLYYQGFNEIPGINAGDRAAVTVAEADSPYGPWKPLGRVVVDFGKEGEWDSDAIHDPYPIIYKGRIYLYYKGSPQKGGHDGTIVRAQGVAIAEHPLGPFRKSTLNPVINSGHETCMFPWKEGVAAIVSLDGAEKTPSSMRRMGSTSRSSHWSRFRRWRRVRSVTMPLPITVTDGVSHGASAISWTRRAAAITRSWRGLTAIFRLTSTGRFLSATTCASTTKPISRRARS